MRDIIVHTTTCSIDVAHELTFITHDVACLDSIACILVQATTRLQPIKGVNHN